MDCTGSMGSWIAAAKETALSTADKIRAEAPRATFRLGFQGYRDYGDSLSVIPLTEDVASVRSQLASVAASGGADAAEDVAGGLKMLLETPVRAETKICLFVADAPAHGMRYHDINVGDNYPKGDKNGLEPSEQMKEVARRGWDFYFIRINSSTDKMVGVFHEAYESAKASEEQTFMVIDLQAQPAAGPAPGGPAPGGGVARRMAEMSLAPAPMPAGLPAMSLAPSSVLEAMPETEADDEEADEGPSALLTTKRKRSARAGAAASASSLCREAPAMPGLPLGPSPCMSMAAPCAPSAMAPARSGPGGPGFGSTSDAFGAALTSSVLNSMNRRAKASTARSAPASSGPS